MTLPSAPRDEMVGGHRGGEAGVLRVLNVSEELSRMDLLVR